jgi:hypothetical protein
MKKIACILLAAGCLLSARTVMAAEGTSVPAEQPRQASKAQMDRVNQKYDEIGKTNSLGARYDSSSGNLYFRLTTYPGNQDVRGFVPPSAELMHLQFVANEGKYRLTAVERISFDAAGKPKGKELATQAQLDKLTEQFFAGDGKLNSLAAFLNERGELEFEFQSEAGKVINGTIPK